jgi:hypothetical protein
VTRDEIIRILRSPEGRDETKRIYRLRVACDLASQVILMRQVTRAEAEELVDGLARFAEELFPDSGETFRIVYGRRFQRQIDEAFGASSS